MILYAVDPDNGRTTHKDNVPTPQLLHEHTTIFSGYADIFWPQAWFATPLLYFLLGDAPQQLFLDLLINPVDQVVAARPQQAAKPLSWLGILQIDRQ